MLRRPLARAQGSGSRPAIHALFRSFPEAYGRRDADAIGALFTEDAILIAPAPVVLGRQAIADNHRGRLRSGRASAISASSSSGSTPRVGLPQGGGERQGNVTSIFRRQAGTLLIHVHTFNFRG